MDSQVTKESLNEDKEIEIRNKLDNFEVKYKKKRIYAFFKRLMDIVGALIGLLLIGWLMIIIAIIIKSILFYCNFLASSICSFVKLKSCPLFFIKLCKF